MTVKAIKHLSIAGCSMLGEQKQLYDHLLTESWTDMRSHDQVPVAFYTQRTCRCLNLGPPAEKKWWNLTDNAKVTVYKLYKSQSPGRLAHAILHCNATTNHATLVLLLGLSGVGIHWLRNLQRYLPLVADQSGGHYANKNISILNIYSDISTACLIYSCTLVAPSFLTAHSMNAFMFVLLIFSNYVHEGEVKVKLCLSTPLRHVKAPRILNLYTTWRWVVNLSPPVLSLTKRPPPAHVDIPCSFQSSCVLGVAGHVTRHLYECTWDCA